MLHIGGDRVGPLRHLAIPLPPRVPLLLLGEPGGCRLRVRPVAAAVASLLRRFRCRGGHLVVHVMVVVVVVVVMVVMMVVMHLMGHWSGGRRGGLLRNG